MRAEYGSATADAPQYGDVLNAAHIDRLAVGVALQCVADPEGPHAALIELLRGQQARLDRAAAACSRAVWQLRRAQLASGRAAAANALPISKNDHT